MKRRTGSLLVNKGMNKRNHKKEHVAAAKDGHKKGSAATAVEEEALGGLGEKYDEVQKLIDIGKEKGYLLYDEVSDLLPPEISSSAEDLDDLFSAFGTAGIEVIDTDDQSFAALDKVTAEKKFEEQPEGDVELDLTPRLSRKRTIPFACTCARWEPCHCSRVMVRLKLPSASSEAN